MKKLLALVLALLMLLTSFAVAEDKLGGLELPFANGDVEITMYFGTQYPMTEDYYFFKRLSELTGVKVKPVVYTKDIAAEKFSTLLATAELPDIFVNSYISGLSNLNMYGDQGALANVYDYLDVMPNFKKIFIDDADNNSLWVTYSSGTTGANYCMPIYKLNRDVNFGWMYRADVLKEVGVEPWTDNESFVAALRAIKAAYPDSYPLSTNANALGLNKRIASHWDMNDLPIAYDWETGKYWDAATSDNYKAMLDFFQGLMTEGLMDPEWFTHTIDSWTAAMLNDRAFVTEQWIGRMALMNDQTAESDPDFDLVYGRPIGNGKMQELSKFSSWGASVANNENTEISMKIVDFLYSDLGSELMTMGLEGETYTINEDGTYTYPEIEGTVTINILEEKYGMWIEGLYLHPARKSAYYAYTPYEQAAQDLINNDCGYTRLPLGWTADNDDDQAIVDQLLAEYNQKMAAFCASYIMNPNAGDAEWAEWVKTARADYSDEMLAIMNK